MQQWSTPLIAGTVRPPVWIVLALLVSGGMPRPVAAQDERPPQPAPIGKFLTIDSPIDDRTLLRVSNTAQQLQQQAAKEQRTAVLVLEITPGTSQFHHVQALSRLLTSSQFAQLQTVAWVPDTVTGPNALIALSCRNIVMHPDAELGDLGRGQPVEPEDQQIALAVAQKRQNPLVSTALIRAMLDPQEQLWRVRVKQGQGEAGRIETRAVTRSELETLRTTGAQIEAAEVIKETGVLGTFRGSTARDLEILVTHVADSRAAIAALYNLPREALREPPPERDVQKARLIRVTDMIDALQENFLKRQIDRALRAGTHLIVFEINSPGGELLASINLAQTIADLDPKQVRTVAYVPVKALSGAAIIALGCDEIYLHPSATIGDAGPIELKVGGAFERAPEKILSPLRAALKTLAEKKNRPVALCEAMADRSLKVFEARNRDTGRVWYLSEAELQQSAGEWIAGPQVREANGELLLTVDGRRAHELLLAEKPVSDLDELKVRIGLPATYRLVPIEKTWIDTTVFVLNLPAVVVLLFILGIGCLYLEVHFPSGLFGIASTLCFAVFFWSKFLGGTAGWLEVILFALGAGCLAMEIFVVPGFGVFGVSGILMVLASIVMASQSWGNLEPNADLRDLVTTLGTIMAAGVAVLVMGLVLGRFLPRVPLFESIILAPPNQGAADEPALEPRLLTEAPVNTAATVAGIATGQQGQTLSMLRPAGKARIGSRVADVVSDGPFIAEGATVEVTKVSGSRIVVRQV
jgi:membrane-bound serine protease (ClpP class)